MNFVGGFILFSEPLVVGRVWLIGIMRTRKQFSRGREVVMTISFIGTGIEPVCDFLLDGRTNPYPYAHTPLRSATPEEGRLYAPSFSSNLPQSEKRCCIAPWIFNYPIVWIWVKCCGLGQRNPYHNPNHV